MKWFKYIKVQITLFYLIASVVLVTVFGVALYYSISNVILNESLSTTKNAVEGSGRYVEGYIDKLKTLAHIIGANPDTMACVGKNENHMTDDVMDLIELSLEADPYLESIVIVSKSGDIISNEADLNMTMSEDMMEQAWYQAAIESEMPVLTSARMQSFSMDKDNWVISISQEITDESGTNIGVLLIDIRYEVLESYFSDLDLGETGYVYILNQGGEVVYHEDTSYFTDEDKQKELRKMAAMVGYDDEMDLLIHPYQLSNADWTLVGVSGLSGLDSVRRQIIETVLVVGLILLVIVLISGMFIAERITKPIKSLEIAMRDTDHQLQQVEIEASGSYEATQLAIQFNKMMERIHQLMGDVKEQEQYLRTYEINALHSQINPHFLYNSLDTIVWMAEFGDSDKVIEITKSLAKFFRLSLSKGQEMIQLSDELEHVKQYLFIQKQRYMEKLNYEFDTSEIPDMKVPKIILQPIVENAIYHGIRDLDRPGKIVIRTHVMADNLSIIIEDNGKGFKYDNKDLPKSSKVKLGGVGLMNVDKRIKLYYGEAYGLSIESVIGKGTKVTLKLKKQMD